VAVVLTVDMRLLVGLLVVLVAPVVERGVIPDMSQVETISRAAGVLLLREMMVG
tara:strand:- start:348 stop:509 length:162 start_codon:yes stop_codon:yes gene_type:complete